MEALLGILLECPTHRMAEKDTTNRRASAVESEWA